MAIRMMEDVGAPLLVSGVNIVVRTSVPDWHDMAIYAMTALGYLGDFMRFGGDFVKNIGVSSLPLSVDKIYERIQGETPATARRASRATYRASRPASRAVGRYPGPAPTSEFQGVRLD